MTGEITSKLPHEQSVLKTSYLQPRAWKQTERDFLENECEEKTFNEPAFLTFEPVLIEQSEQVSREREREQIF